MPTLTTQQQIDLLNKEIDQNEAMIREAREDNKRTFDKMQRLRRENEGLRQIVATLKATP